MSELPPLRDVIARYGLAARKSLGQNFLLDTQLLDRIAAIPGDLTGETVYEVGPGPGGLTRALLGAGARVVAVERDKRCVAALEELGAHYHRKLRVIEADALQVDEEDMAGRGAHIVANLPYNIGTALLVRWLGCENWRPWWQSLTLMFQKEVAERIIAIPGTSAYGRLSILAQWRSSAEIAMKVHRSAFVPPPRVMSAVVHIRPLSEPEGVRSAILEQLTQAAFGQRRKMLRQSVRTMSDALDAMERLGIDEKRRAETLSVQEYIDLAREIGAIRG